MMDLKKLVLSVALLLAQGLLIPAAVADSDCDWGGGTLDSMCAASVEVSQLPRTLPGFAGISSLEGSAGLLGSGPLPTRPDPRGTLCPDFFICTATEPLEKGYRQVEIDSGAYARTSTVHFRIDAAQQHANFSAAGIDSLAILQVGFDRGRLTVYLDRGPSSTSMQFRAILAEDATGFQSSYGPVTINHEAGVSLVVQSTPYALQRLQLEVGSQMLVDSGPNPGVKWGKPLQLLYGSLATIADSFPQNSVVALQLLDWQVRIGELTEYSFGPRSR